MQNQNNNIYGGYQSNTSNNVNGTNGVKSNNQNNQMYNNISNTGINNGKPKGKKALKIVMIVIAALVVISLGGFALVYTGIIKIGYVEPKSILLNTTNLGVKRGKEYQYDYQVYPENTTAKNVIYESSDPTIADVNPYTGYVTPLKEGTVSIIVKSKDSDTVVENSTLTVTKNKVPVESIQLSNERIVFDLGGSTKSQLIKTTLEPYNATNQNLEFYSSDENVAIVDPTGRVFPVGFGMATITVRTSDSDAIAKCEVIVTDTKNKLVYFTAPDGKKLVFPYSIELEYNYLKLRYGESRKVGFTLLPPDVTEDVVTWFSSDPNVATVKEGLVQAVAIGQATVTARTVNDLIATLTVDVTDEEIEPTTVELDQDVESLNVGDGKVLTPKYDYEATVSNTVWSSSDPSVVSVDSEGNITATGEGEAYITAQIGNGETATKKVSVAETPVTTYLTPAYSEMTLAVGESETLQIEADTTDTKYIYKSNNENVVTVNERGLIYAVAPGVAKIIVSTVNGLSTEVTINVESIDVAKITIVAPSQNISVGDSVELGLKIYPENATNKNVVWTSSDKSVLTVDNGDVKALAAGSATVTAKIGDLSNSFTFNVTRQSANSTSNKTVKTVANKSSKKSVKRLADENDDFGDELPLFNTVLNDSEKEKLKDILLDYERISDNRVIFKFDLQKYGFYDFVDVEKTEFLVLVPKQNGETNNFTKATFTYYGQEKTEEKLLLEPSWFYLDYNGYGTFDVSISVTLNTGEKIEVKKNFVSIQELPIEGVQPIKITNKVAQAPSTSTSTPTGGGTSTGTSNSGSKPITNSITIKVKKGVSTKPVFRNNETTAAKVTNWKSSDTKVALVSTNKVITALNVGTATITGTYKNYSFTINVIVEEGNEIIKRENRTTFTYGSCLNLCSGSTLKETNIPTNHGVCGSTKPYYINMYNQEYYYTCLSGNVETKTTGMSTSAPQTANLEFNYANSAKVNPGETINVIIKNWQLLNLQSVKITNSLTKTTVTQNSPYYNLTIPSNPSSKSITLNFVATNNQNRTYAKSLVLNIIDNTITSIGCKESMIIYTNQTGDLGCVGYNSAHQPQELKNPEYTVDAAWKNYVSVDQSGKVTGLKITKNGKQAKIVVTDNGITATAYVTVQDPVIFDKLEIITQSGRRELALGESITVTVNAIRKNKNDNVTRRNATVDWESSDSAVAVVQDGKIYAKNSGTATLTATFTNQNGNKISEDIQIKVNGSTASTKEFKNISCSTLIMLVGDTMKLKCSINYKDPDTPSDTLVGATYSFSSLNLFDWFVSVDNNGNVKAKRATGTSPVKINVKYEFNQIKDDTEVNVYVYDKISNVELKTNNLNIDLKTGAKITYTAMLNDSQVTSGLDLKWVIDPAGAATIDKDGNLTLIKNIDKDSLNVSATYRNKTDSSDKSSNTLSFKVGKVNELVPTSITCKKKSIRIMEGLDGDLGCQINFKNSETPIALNSTNATFKSSSPKNVKVDDNGHYVASEIDSSKNDKTTTSKITIKPKDKSAEYENLFATVDIEVYQAIAHGIDCDKSYETKVGDPPHQLSCTLTYQESKDHEVDMSSEVTYDVSDDKVVNVTKDGLVTPVGPGEATITITSKAKNTYRKGNKAVDDIVVVTVPEIYHNFSIALSYPTIELSKNAPVRNNIYLTADVDGQKNGAKNNDLTDREYSITSKTGASTAYIAAVVDRNGNDYIQILPNTSSGTYTLKATIKNKDKAKTPVTATYDFVVEDEKLKVKEIKCSHEYPGVDKGERPLVGESGSLICKMIYEKNGSGKTEDKIPLNDLKVTSNNPKVVSVTSSNTLNFNSSGTAKITVAASFEGSGDFTTSFDVKPQENKVVYDSLEITLGTNTFTPGSSTTIGYKATKKGSKDVITSGLDVKFTIPNGFTHDEAKGKLIANKDALPTHYSIIATLNNRGNSAPITAYTNIFINSTGGVEKKPKNIFCSTVGLEKDNTATLSCSVNYCYGSSATATCDPVTLNLSTDKPTFTSNDTSVATVDKNGLVKAEKAGSTKITVNAKINSIDVSGTATINVYPKFDKFSITFGNNATTKKIDMNGYAKIIYKASNSKNNKTASSGLNVTYSSDNVAVAIVDENGIVTPRSPGTAHITANYKKGFFSSINSNEVTITVVEAGEPTKNVAAIECEKPTLEAGQTATLVCKYKYSATDKNPKDIVTYTSAISNKPKVVKVTYNKDSIKVEALKDGEANITITAYGKSTSFKIKVKKPPVYNKINLSISKTKILYDEVTTLSCTLEDTSKKGSAIECGDKVTYTLSRKNIVRLNGTKVIPTAVQGSTTITATYNPGGNKKAITQNVDVSVVETQAETINVTKLDCKKPSDTMRTSYGQIECTAYDANNEENIPLGNATYKVKDSSIVSMLNDSNMFQAKKVGSTKVTVTSNTYHKSADVTVKVTPFYDTFTSMSATRNIAIGSNGTISYTIKDSKSGLVNTNDTSATIKSSNPNIATVSGKTIKGVSAGNTTISVTWGGITKTQNVRVYKSVTCYSFYKKKTTSSCPSGSYLVYERRGDKCYKIVNKTQAKCNGSGESWLSYANKCVNKQNEVKKEIKEEKSGNPIWTSNKTLWLNDSKYIFGKEAKCDTTCSLDNC